MSNHRGTIGRGRRPGNAAAILLALCALTLFQTEANEDALPAPPSISDVYLIRDMASLRPGRIPTPSVIQRMVDRLVMSVTGKQTPAEAWRSLVAKNETVGIKVAASGANVSGTHPEVVDAVVNGLIAAGIPPKNIIVWDRNLADLLAAGYRRDGENYQLRWIDPRTGYDPKAVLSAPVLGKLIWGDSAFGSGDGREVSRYLAGTDQLSSRSYYAKVLTTEVKKIINIPSLSDSFLTGVNGAFANMTIANIDNWRRFTKPPDFGDPYLAEIYSDPIIREKVVLTILDGLIVQYAGGPGPSPGFLLDYYTLFASEDPVAIDSIALKLLDEARAPAKLPSLAPMSRWLESAKISGLGNDNPERIDLHRLDTGG